MTATNHALTGATIALAMHGSIWAIPIAFVSHFALDSLPHFGVGKGFDFVKTGLFSKILAVDIILCLLLALAITINQSMNWFIVVLSAFAASSPDLMWLQDYIGIKQHKTQKPRAERSFIVHFHAWVQWYQRPTGAYFEAVWFVVMGSLCLHFLR